MSLQILPVDPGDRRRVRQFIDLPFRLYAGVSQWVPPFRGQLAKVLARRHPFFRHSEAQSFLALRSGRDGEPVGRITAFENRGFNSYRGRSSGRFYHFECEQDGEAAAGLLETACAWARKRGLTELVGPYGFASIDGGGLLVDGFEHRATMTMMHYHHPYYAGMLEAAGFRKERDFYTALLERSTFALPEKIRRVVELILKRGRFTVPVFRSKREVLRLAGRIGEVYNRAFATHGDFCPLSPDEIEGLAHGLMRVSHPSLIKVLLYDGEIVGFLFAFPDLSAALQRARGRVGPLQLLDLLREGRRTESLVVNGAGILPEYQKLGGNGLLYHELIDGVMRSRYRRVEMVQIAETTDLMLADMQTLGGRVYKTHRIFRKSPL